MGPTSTTALNLFKNNEGLYLQITIVDLRVGGRIGFWRLPFTESLKRRGAEERRGLQGATRALASAECLSTTMWISRAHFHEVIRHTGHKVTEEGAVLSCHPQ